MFWGWIVHAIHHTWDPGNHGAVGITKQSARQITRAIFSALGQSRVLY
jgi:hypothetical protein